MRTAARIMSHSGRNSNALQACLGEDSPSRLSTAHQHRRVALVGRGQAGSADLPAGPPLGAILSGREPSAFWARAHRGPGCVRGRRYGLVRSRTGPYLARHSRRFERATQMPPAGPAATARGVRPRCGGAGGSRERGRPRSRWRNHRPGLRDQSIAACERDISALELVRARSPPLFSSQASRAMPPWRPMRRHAWPRVASFPAKRFHEGGRRATPHRRRIHTRPSGRQRFRRTGVTNPPVNRPLSAATPAARRGREHAAARPTGRRARAKYDGGLVSRIHGRRRFQ